MKATSHITPTVNIKPTVPSRPSDYTQLLPPFSLQFLPLTFCYISGVDFTYHHYFHHSVDIWIASIIPLIQLLVASFHLKYIFLFCRCDLSLSRPFDSVVKVIQEAVPLWHLSTYDDSCVITTLSWRVGMYRANHMHAREIVFVWYSLAMQCRNRKFE